MAEKRFLDTPELAEMVQVTPAAVEKWVQQGCPCHKRGNRRTFDRVEVAEWCAQSKMRHKYIPRLAPAAGDGAKPPDAGDSVEQFADVLARARWCEQQAFKMANENPDNQLYQAHHKDMADSLRRMEKDWPEIQLKAGMVVRKDLIFHELGTAFGVLKSRFLNFVDSLEPEIQAKIKERFREEFRQFAKQLREQGMMEDDK